MPAYDFRCPQCEKTVEKIFAIYTNSTEWCEECEVPMEKQFSAPGVIFKGTGWGKDKK